MNDAVLTTQNYRDAFKRLGPKITGQQWQILRELYSAPGRAMSAAELASAFGYSGPSAANGIFGKLGRVVAAEIGFTPQTRKNGTPMQWTALAVADVASERTSQFRWKMRPELAACLEEILPQLRER